MFEDWLTKYWYLLLGGVFALLGPAVIFIYMKLRNQEEGKSIFDFILVWPLLIDQHKKANKGSNRFIIVCSIIMVLLIAFGIWTDRGPHRG